MKIIILILIFIFIIGFHVPRIIKRKQRSEMVIFTILLVLGFSLSLGQIMELKIPNPNNVIINIIDRITFW